MKIWENFKTFGQAAMMLKRRKCWSRCYSCGKTWAEIMPKTIHVHMTMMIIDKKQETRFICDECLKGHKQKKQPNETN